MSRRRYKGNGSTFGKIIMLFIIISLMAIGVGYGFTKYIITPYFSGELKEEKPIENKNNSVSGQSSIIIDQQDIKTIDQTPSGNETKETPENTQTGSNEIISSTPLYCVQYGSFSEMSGAEAMSSTLATQNIETFIVEKGGAYKLIGVPHIDKERANASLEKGKTLVGDDLFLTTVEVMMK